MKGIWSIFFAIPELSLTFIVAIIGLIALFLLSLVPGFNAILWGGILIAAAYFLPAAIIYKKKGWKLTIKSVLAMSGLLLIMVGLFGQSVTQFFYGFGYIGSITGSLGAISGVGDAAFTTEAFAETIKFASSIILLVASVLEFHVLRRKKVIK